MSVNRVVLVGRLVRDPELRTTNSGKNVAEFTIAVQKRVKPQDGGPDADFFRCKAWNQSADYLYNYGLKGRLMVVDGRLECRKWTDQSGNNRESIEVVADNVSLLDKAQDADQQGQGENIPKKGYGSAPAEDEYDPFAEEA